MLNALPSGKKLTIAIDIDGTVADCSGVDFNRVDEDPNELMKAKPRGEALAAIKELYRHGHKIVFYSSRDHKSLAVTKRWLKKCGFPFHHIEMGKFVAHVYIDDRAISGRDWKRAMKEINKKNLPGALARKRGRT
jgi:hydroxymethylpyrimidine pyrophosphatase-like HAD family hydrolase